MRTTVYVPDDLATRAEKWKDRINVSSLLQDALSREISRLEAIPTSIEDLDSVVERLRGEKGAWEQKWYEVGTRFGTEWARQAAYPRLKGHAESWKTASRRKNPAPPISNALSLALWELSDDGQADPDFVLDSGLLAKYPSLKEIYGYDDEMGGFASAYDVTAFTRGWADATLAFWDTVKGLL